MSVFMEELDPNSTNFRKILYWDRLLKLVKKMGIWLNQT